MSVTESALLMRMREDVMDTGLLPDGESVREVSVSEPAEMLKKGREIEVSVKEMEVTATAGLESASDRMRK